MSVIHIYVNLLDMHMEKINRDHVICADAMTYTIMTMIL